MNAETLYKRLIEYRIDFAYSKELYFAASNRLKIEYSKKENQSKVLNIISVSLALISLTALQLYINKTFGEGAIYVVSGISLISVIVSLYLFFHKNEKEYLNYFQRANEYLAIYKHVKNLEAKYSEGLLNRDSLFQEIEGLNQMQQKLNANLLPTILIDYNLSKAAIQNGNAGYTQAEEENT